MDGDLHTFTVRNGDGRDEIRALLEAHLEYRRRRAERANLEWAVIIASALPALSVVSPWAVPVGVRLIAFVPWAGLLATLVVARLSERRSYRRMLDREGGDEG